MKAEPPEERTLAFISAEKQVMFVRFVSSYQRDQWISALEVAAANLLARYLPSDEPDDDDSKIKLSIITAEKSANAKIASFLVEGSWEGRKWEVWRSYEEFEEMHQKCVHALVGHMPQTPLFPTRRKGQSLGDFKSEMHEYISTVATIPIIAENSQFLRFCGAQ
eukprot:TRINITY_DN15122_c0_g1_i1.p1 TRINITY_DN15122_c0_g1~~TRINITY_DN15122_c0_g1_i1.p1  ORF type:complete len:164 (-),score=41.83 TRINITY_DN15122_c0_g1_i1:32-523(-)